MFGRLASLPLFRVLRVPVFTAYGLFTGVNFDEVAKPLASYESLNNFFTRSLKAGLRPIAGIYACVPSAPMLWSRAVLCCTVLR